MARLSRLPQCDLSQCRCAPDNDDEDDDEDEDEGDNVSQQHSRFVVKNITRYFLGDLPS